MIENFLMHAYNAKNHEITGFSPFYLMFGHRPMLTIDAFLGVKPNTDTGSSQIEYANALRTRLDFAYKKASEEAAKG